MAGGPRGPVPKRSAQRRRRNIDAKPDIVALPVSSDSTERPLASEFWPETVSRLYESLAKSGQSQFYEPSDWAFAHLLCDMLARGFAAEKMPALIVTGVMADLARLGVTEGDRRRMRIELERADPNAQPASISRMDKYRRAAGNK